MARSDLFDAIRKNSLRQMQLLLESGCDVDSRNANSETPLMAALYGLRQKEQRERAMKHLLNAGADVNARSCQGQTALTFACALDQSDSIRLLLQQDGIDVNLGDVSGVTPLMLSAALGHRTAVTTLMEFARSGHVRLDLQARDDSDFTAADYATQSGNTGLADYLRDHHNVQVKTTGSRTTTNGNGNLLKARNMNNTAKGGPRGKGSHRDGEEVRLIEASQTALRESNLPAIQQFAREVKHLHAQNDSNLAAITRSPRPGSRSSNATSVRSRPQSREQATSRAGSRVGGGHNNKSRPGSRVSSYSKTNSSLTANNDDDDDLDLSSLRELMGTVREAAKEIREIVEPLQKEKEQTARPRDRKHRSRRRNVGHRNYDHHRQIQAEIHAVSEVNGHPVPPLPPTSPLTPTAPFASYSHSPPSDYLHVENEELSRTWPRQSGRSVSRERSQSRNNAVGSPTCERSSPTQPTRSFHGSDTPRVSPIAAKSEQEILERVVRRQHVGSDPLVAAINNFNTTPKARLIMESRQRIVGRARDHWALQQTCHSQAQPLPHITVSEHRARPGNWDPPPSDQRPSSDQDVDDHHHHQNPRFAEAEPQSVRAAQEEEDEEDLPPESSSTSPASSGRPQPPGTPPSSSQTPASAEPSASARPDPHGRATAGPGQNNGTAVSGPGPNGGPSRTSEAERGQEPRPDANRGPAPRAAPSNRPPAPRPAPPHNAASPAAGNRKADPQAGSRQATTGPQSKLPTPAGRGRGTGGGGDESGGQQTTGANQVPGAGRGRGRGAGGRGRGVGRPIAGGPPPARPGGGRRAAP